MIKAKFKKLYTVLLRRRQTPEPPQRRAFYTSDGRPFHTADGRQFMVRR